MRNFRSKAVVAPLAAIAMIMGGSLAIAAPDLDLAGSDKPVVAPPAENTHGTAPAERPAEKPSDKPAKPTDKPAKPTDTPTDGPLTGPSIHGLCNAYQAGGYAHSTKNGTKVNPAWESLELAAGGAANLEAFCAAELAKPKPVDDSDNAPKPDKVEKPEKVKADKPDKVEKPEEVKADKAEKPDKGDKPDER